MQARRVLVWAVFTSSLALLGCGAAGTPRTNSDNFGWVQQGDAYARPGEGGFDVRWSRQLTDRFEARFLPVQLSSAEFDLRRKRVYIGTTEGNMFAYTEKGERLYFYDAGAQIESKPAIDSISGEMYFASVDGTVHALTLSGEPKWKSKLIGAMRTQPLVTPDAIYLVAENDSITAMARDDGRILWTYEKEPVEEITIAS